MTTFPSNTVVHRDLPYALSGHPRHTLDLYLPIGRQVPCPLIVWIHGGAFRMGAKDNFEFNSPPFEMLQHGCAIASINYRLSQHAIWPAQIIDCNAAVRWLRANANRYGLNPDRVCVWGPSAGGHLAAMVGLTPAVGEFAQGRNLECTSAVSCVVDFFGPTDFLQMDAQRMPDGMLHDPADSPESQLIGGPIQQLREATARANPIQFVTSSAPAFLIVHGDCDPLVPYGQSLLLESALRKAGVAVEFYTVEGGGHGGFTDPAVPPLAIEFASRHLLV